MSVDRTTDENPAIRNSSDVLGIPRIFRTASEDVGNVHIDADNSVAGAAKRERIKGGNQRDRKNNIGAFVFGGGLNAVQNIVFNDQIKDQLEQLRNTVQSVGSVLGTANVVAFGFTAALAAMGLKPEKLKPATPDGRARATTTDEPDGKTRPRTASPDVPERAATESLAKVATEEGVEAAARPVAQTVARNLAEEGAEVAAKGIFGALFDGAKVVGKFFKRVPVVGAVITGGFVAYEVGSFALQRDFQNAGAAFAAGGAEMAGNIVGFGAGDALREGVRAAFVTVGGETYEDVAKSDIRAVGEMGFDLIQEFTGAAEQPQTAYAPTQAPGFNPALGLNG